jgi:hypothetical protein
MSYATSLDHADALAACAMTEKDADLILLNEMCASHTCHEPMPRDRLSAARARAALILSGYDECLKKTTGSRGADEESAEFVIEQLVKPLCHDNLEGMYILVTSGQNASRRFIVDERADGKFERGARIFASLAAAAGAFAPKLF